MKISKAPCPVIKFSPLNTKTCKSFSWSRKYKARGQICTQSSPFAGSNLYTKPTVLSENSLLSFPCNSLSMGASPFAGNNLFFIFFLNESFFIWYPVDRPFITYFSKGDWSQLEAQSTGYFIPNSFGFVSKLGLDLSERKVQQPKEGWANFTEISRIHYNTSVPREPSKLPSLNGEVSQNYCFKIKGGINGSEIFHRIFFFKIK